MHSKPKGLGKSPAWLGERVNGGWWHCQPHIDLMNRAAWRVMWGEVSRQLTNTPPQVGKSQFWSRLVPACYLGHFPDRRVILGSYNAENAAEWGEKTRDLLEEHGEEYFGITIRQDHRARDNWMIAGHRGGMRTMGMNGGITGKPGDLILIDDPIKGWEQASSPTEREKVWKTYVTSVVSRLQPDSAICLTYTPWHPDDLGGRLLQLEPQHWEILRIPALAEEPVSLEERQKRVGYMSLVGAPDPMGRQPGTAIWPARYSEADYERTRNLDPHEFDALYQCSPHPAEGGMFKRKWFDGKVGVLPPSDATYIRAWDTAASQSKRADWTVGVLVGKQGGAYWVEHVERFRAGPGERDEIMLSTARADEATYPFRVKVVIEEGPSSGGKAEGLSLIQKLAGFDVVTERPDGNKEARARVFASQCQGGNVRLVEGRWIQSFMDELMSFPGGMHDDQVDATSLAFKFLHLAEEPTGYASMSQIDYSGMAGVFE